MRICLLCATERGHLFLQRLIELAPDAELTVASFRETPHEPPFLDSIRKTAQAAGADFVETRRVDRDENEVFWNERPFDLLLAVSWRYLVPPSFYRRATRGAYVFHDSLLPRNRGFSPTVWAIAKGEDHSGVTLFEMVEGVDAGDIIGQRRVAIESHETIRDVLPKVTDVYLELLAEHLPALCAGTAERTPQDHTLATETRRRTDKDNTVDWSAPAAEIYNLVRALTRPYPGALAEIEGETVRIWSSRIADRKSPQREASPGLVLSRPDPNSVLVATGDGVLEITEFERVIENHVGEAA